MLSGAGHHVVVASWQKGPELPGADLRIAPAVGGRLLRRVPLAALWLRRLIREVRPDVVHVHSLGTYALLSLALPGGPGRVLSPYGGDLRAARHSAIRAAMLGVALRRADVVLPCSAELGAEVMERYAVSPARVNVLSWGVAEDLIAVHSSISRSAVRWAFGIPDDATVVLSVRSTSATYRTLEIVSAFAEAATSRPDLFLVVLAGGQLDRESARRVQEAYFSRVREEARTVADRVLIVDRTLGQRQTFELMSASDLAVSIPPGDQHSYSVLEAALAGCHLLLSDIAPYREMMSDGLDTELLAEPICSTLARRLRVVAADEASRRRNREFILTHEHGADKLAAHERIYRQLSARA
jgi:glycosyltransferase involved in cell wall biosynthesis